METRQTKELARLLRRPLEHIQIALDVIKHLDPRPGLRHSGPGARQVEPDVYISKDGEDYVIQISDDDVPQLRLNPQYRRMLDREQEPNRDVRSYIKERYASAIQLMKNIEQRKQTILKVCQSVVRRQMDFLEFGIDQLKPMMIKEIAEEIGVHPSTVSRAVSNKYAHTPQGVFELRYFFSEAVQGPGGGATPLLILKRRVKKMIEEEDPMHPLTDEQITERLQAEGIEVTRRTVAKYREDMRIPSTHQRRVRGPKRCLHYESRLQGNSASTIRPDPAEAGPHTLPSSASFWTAAASGKPTWLWCRSGICIAPKSPCSFTIISWWAMDRMPICSHPCTTALGKLETQAVKTRGKWREKHRRKDAPKKGAEPRDRAARRSPRKAAAKKVFRVNGAGRRKPMTLDEAVLEMDHKRDYLVYRDVQREGLSVLVRRSDGHFDLIES